VRSLKKSGSKLNTTEIIDCSKLSHIRVLATGYYKNNDSAVHGGDLVCVRFWLFRQFEDQKLQLLDLAVQNH
jgi:hypothetical protein